MKAKLLPVILVFSLTTGCNQGGSGNLRPARGATHESVNANVNLGVEYMRQGNYEKALEKLDRASQIDPGYYETYNMYGLLYQRLGEYREAENNFRKALSLNSNNPSTLNNYGQFLCRRSRPAEAEEVFMKAVRYPLNETPEVALTNAAICAQRNGQLDKAENYFRQALEINPKLSEALLRMAQISYENGNYLSARGYLTRYLENSRHTAQSLWLGIRIERQLGDKNAVSSYTLLLKNNFPDSREAGLLEQN